MKSPRFPAVLAWLLALSLLLSSVWGQWHRVAHEAWGPTLLAAAPSDAGHDHSGHDAGGALCQLLDHLAHADGLSMFPPAWVGSVAPDGVAAVAVASQVQAAKGVPFQARAPPFSV